jgi:hypothetical protein
VPAFSMVTNTLSPGAYWVRAGSILTVDAPGTVGELHAAKAIAREHKPANHRSGLTIVRCRGRADARVSRVSPKDLLVSPPRDYSRTLELLLVEFGTEALIYLRNWREVPVSGGIVGPVDTHDARRLRIPSLIRDSDERGDARPPRAGMKIVGTAARAGSERPEVVPKKYWLVARRRLCAYRTIRPYIRSSVQSPDQTLNGRISTTLTPTRSSA